MKVNTKKGKDLSKRIKEIRGKKPLSAKDVTGKTVKFKDGSVVKIVGGGDDTLLLEWPSGSVSGFGNVNNIEYVFDIKE